MKIKILRDIVLKKEAIMARRKRVVYSQPKHIVVQAAAPPPAYSSLGNKTIVITAAAFLRIIEQLLDENNKEIAGFGVYDMKEEAIVWIGDADIETHSATHVKSGVAPATLAALDAGYEGVNVQWHTHPGMAAYFSSTDMTDQFETMTSTLKGDEKEGVRVFIVGDKLYWRHATYFFKDGKCDGYYTGYLQVGGSLLNYGSYSSYGNYARGVYAGYSWQDYQPAQTGTPTQATMRFSDNGHTPAPAVADDEEDVVPETEYVYFVPVIGADGKQTGKARRVMYIVGNEWEHVPAGRHRRDYTSLLIHYGVPLYDFESLRHAIMNEFDDLDFNAVDVDGAYQIIMSLSNDDLEKYVDGLRKAEKEKVVE